MIEQELFFSLSDVERFFIPGKLYQLLHGSSQTKRDNLSPFPYKDLFDKRNVVIDDTSEYFMVVERPFFASHDDYYCVLPCLSATGIGYIRIHFDLRFICYRNWNKWQPKFDLDSNTEIDYKDHI